MPTPESSLPVEILELIFSFCVPWLRTESSLSKSPCSYYPASRRPPHPLAFTEVCRRWTWVARTSPRLWSVIDLSNTGLTHYSTTYATYTTTTTYTTTKRPLAPLHIISGAPAPKITLSHIADTCASLSRSSHSHQPHAHLGLSVSTIDVSLYPIVLSSLFAALTGPRVRIDFAYLTKLVLRVPPMAMFTPIAFNLTSDAGHHNHTTPGSVPVPAHAPSSISSLPLPAVRHLELDGVPVLWASLRSLTHLSLRGLAPPSDGEQGSAPTLHDLQSILSRSSETLEFCRLENTLFSIDAQCDIIDGMDVEPPTFMHRLHTLSISAPPQVAASILSCVVVPATAHVQLYTLVKGDLREVLPSWFRIGAEHQERRILGADADTTPSSLRLCRHSAAFLRRRKTRAHYHPGASASSDWDAGDAVFSVSSASSAPLPMGILDSVSYPSSSSSSSFSWPSGSNTPNTLNTLNTFNTLTTLPTRYTFPTGIYDLQNLLSLTLGVGVLLDIPPASLRTFLVYGAVNLEELRVGYQCDLGGLLGCLVPLAVILPTPHRTVGGYGECGAPARNVCVNAGKEEEPVEPIQRINNSNPCPRLKLLAFNRPSDRWWNFAALWLDAVVSTVVRRSRNTNNNNNGNNNNGNNHDNNARVSLRLEFWRCHGVKDGRVVGEAFERVGAEVGEVGEVVVVE